MNTPVGAGARPLRLARTGELGVLMTSYGLGKQKGTPHSKRCYWPSCGDESDTVVDESGEKEIALCRLHTRYYLGVSS
jgi:hypothetical protein